MEIPMSLLNWFDNSLYAAEAGQPDPLMSFLPLLVIFGVFYFMLIRPQSKRAKQHRQMVDELTEGAEVITTGGMLGKVVKLRL